MFIMVFPNRLAEDHPPEIKIFISITKNINQLIIKENTDLEIIWINLTYLGDINCYFL